MLMKYFAYMFLIYLTACATTPKQPDIKKSQVEIQSTQMLNIESVANLEDTKIEVVEDDVEADNSNESLLAIKRGNFAYDSDAIDAQFAKVIAAHAKYLLDHPDALVLIAGHTDERGTKAYNLALGERRANSVQQLMIKLGVPARQLAIISYGEENPVNRNSTPSAWKENRRVDITY